MRRWTILGGWCLTAGLLAGVLSAANGPAGDTKAARMVAEVYGAPVDDRNAKRMGQPLVHVAFDHQPLERALAELSRQTGRTITLDLRVADRDKLAATVRLLNAPLDTAVRLLAE